MDTGTSTRDTLRKRLFHNKFFGGTVEVRDYERINNMPPFLGAMLE